MFSKYSKRSRYTLTALAIAVIVLVGLLMASPPFMVADSHAQKKQTLRAVVSYVDTQAGLVVLWLPVGPEVQNLQRGDSIAIMVEGVAGRDGGDAAATALPVGFSVVYGESRLPGQFP
jgi:hypothetical protein